MACADDGLARLGQRLLLALTIPLSILVWLPVILTFLCRKLLLLLRIGSPIPRLKYEESNRPRVFFDGGGYAFHFYLGIVQHIQETYDTKALDFFGISIGTLPALCLALDLNPFAIVEQWYPPLLQKMHSRPLDGFMGTLKPIRELLLEVLPLDAHERASGRLHILVSGWPFLGFRVVSHYPSREALIRTLLCSCAMPGFVWRPLVLGCWWWLDPGLQNMLTPVDTVMDVAVRVFPPSFGPQSVVPESFFDPVKDGGRPLSLEEALASMDRGKQVAIQHPGLRHALERCVLQQPLTVLHAEAEHIEPCIDPGIDDPVSTTQIVW
eukprot:GGOE01061824.1.p1 GENE.GGOE01061824.1~~GGOE01061824.1.p1  ORF type:complete len:375 (+),score=75.57 GGOE01061824.1:156-1127(+)